MTFDRREFLKRSALAGSAVIAASALPGCGQGESQTGETPEEGGIVRYAVHPTIGIARVGNSASGFYLTPELPGELPAPAGGFKDARGAIKRQAARFRVYGYDARGVAVREITADEADIVWSVHVANRKAAWYEFTTALDIPGASPARRRNREFSGSQRATLVVDPGRCEIAGRDRTGVFCDGGTFLGQEISLGELRTDDQGRLLFLGGHGRAINPRGAALSNVANNDGWCDDIADGAIRATIRVGGVEVEAEPGWVVSTPPNYGPSIAAGFTTMYDVIEQVMVDEAWIGRSSVSFLAHVLPIFLRLADMQWVNQGISELFGFGAPDDLDQLEFLTRLADPEAANASFRRSWFERFRDPAYLELQPDALPPIYGDNFTYRPDNPRRFLAPTSLQFERLRAWAAGEFENDFAGRADLPTAFADLPVEHQPAALDRAALEPILGGSFHPGIECSWVLRSPLLYAGPFRLRAPLVRDSSEQDHGDALTPEVALSAEGPLAGSGPGALTRWLATPWHTDAVSCRSGYGDRLSPYLPTFWPARAPNHVLTDDDYRVVVDPNAAATDRQQAFARRRDWLRHFDGLSYTESLNLMVKSWPKLGVVALAPGPGDEIAPPVVKVETDSGFVSPDGPKARG